MQKELGFYIEQVVGMVGDNRYLQAFLAVAIGIVLAWIATGIPALLMLPTSAAM